MAGRRRAMATGRSRRGGYGLYAHLRFAGLFCWLGYGRRRRADPCIL